MGQLTSIPTKTKEEDLKAGILESLKSQITEYGEEIARLGKHVEAYQRIHNSIPTHGDKDYDLITRMDEIRSRATYLQCLANLAHRSTAKELWVLTRSVGGAPEDEQS